MEKTKERVLYVNGGTMDMGGISSYMLNYYRNFNKDKIQIDFIVQGEGGEYDSEIEKMGGRVYHLPTKRKNYIKNMYLLHKIMSQGNYKIIHAHADGMNGHILKKAFYHKIPIRISHSHNTEHLTKNKIRLLYHENARKKIPRFATHLWACSGMAGKWLYGNENQFEIIPNAIDTEKYAYNEEKRKELREKYQLESRYVIGHVGKLEYQKNQEFLIKILPEIIKKNENTRLVLVGDGKNRRKLEQMISELKMNKYVLMLGKMSNVNELLNMFDVFVLPSRFEGFPVVSIEVQTNGLAMICSDKVTKETNVTDRVRFISLDDEDKWIRTILENPLRCPKQLAQVRIAGYDIKEAAGKLQNRYLHMMETGNKYE